MDDMNRKVSNFAVFLGITEDAFDAKRIVSKEQFIDEIISILLEHPQLFRLFLYKIFDVRVREALNNSFAQKGFRDDEPIENILRNEGVVSKFKVLESETGLMFPRPVLSNLSFYMQIILLLFPAIFFVVMFVLNIELMPALYGVVKIGAIGFFIVIPYFITYLVFPKLFAPTKLSGIKTYHDLIMNLVWTNQFVFIEDEYTLTKSELSKLIDSL